MHRLALNNWSAHVIKTVLDEVRDWPRTHRFTRSTVLSQMRKAFNTTEPNNPSWEESDYRSRNPHDPPVTNYTTTQFEVFQQDGIKDDVKLSQLAVNVKSFSTGEEDGVLTAAIELVRAQPQLERPFSELVEFAQQHGLASPTYDVRKDRASFGRWMGVAVEKYSKGFWRQAKKGSGLGAAGIDVLETKSLS